MEGKPYYLFQGEIIMKKTIEEYEKTIEEYEETFKRIEEGEIIMDYNSFGVLWEEYTKLKEEKKKSEMV